MSPSDGKPVTASAALSASAATIAPPMDGRQSAAALAIARGTGRLLVALGCMPIPELVLPSGRRADLFAVSEKGELWLVEIKSSIEDFKSDQKWPEYLPFCDRFFFAVDNAFPLELIPEEAGLIVADRYGAEMVRESPFDRATPAVRKAMTLRMARVSAARLNALHDPEGARELLAVRE